MRKKQRHKYKTAPKIVIETDGTITHVKIDGKEIRGVRSLRMEAESRKKIPTVWLEMNALDMEMVSTAPIPVIERNRSIEYLREFAESIDMLWAIAEDKDFFIKDHCVWVKNPDGTEVEYDDRVEQFVAIRNMVCSFVPNVDFRGDEYIGYRDKGGNLYEGE